MTQLTKSEKKYFQRDFPTWAQLWDQLVLQGIISLLENKVETLENKVVVLESTLEVSQNTSNKLSAELDNVHQYS